MDALKGLKLVCSSAVVDRENSTAQLRVCEPIKKEVVITFDKPWEGNTCAYGSMVYTGKIYRMYYLAHDSSKNAQDVKVCVLESKDGITWERPILGIREYNGSKENNIVIDITDRDRFVPVVVQNTGTLATGEVKESQEFVENFIDNFFCFKDTNPNCKKDEIYKAFIYNNIYRLETMYSEDGINFRRGNDVGVPGKFDTLNTCFYDERLGKYVAYFRDFHNVPEDGDLNKGIRDVRRSVSDDFINWSTPELIKFNNDAEDYPLYTNHIMRYPRNTDYYIGFPTRYYERLEWTDNYDKLCGREDRLERMKDHPRLGLALTDCVFMISDDGINWDRFEQPIFRPDIENGINWIYGDCYPEYALVDCGNYYSMFMEDGHRFKNRSSTWTRYEIRKDGFVYYEADCKKKKVVLKKGILSSNKIFVNFATAVRGNIFIKVSDMDGNEVITCEMFGNSINREASFEKGVLDKFVGKEVKIEIEMLDAKLYSISF